MELVCREIVRMRKGEHLGPKARSDIRDIDMKFILSIETLRAFFPGAAVAYSFLKLTHGTKSTLFAIPLVRNKRLNVPNHIRILLDAPVAAEEAHPADARDALFDPGVLVLVRLVHERVRLDVAVEVVGDEVVVALVDDGVAQGAEAARVAELTALDGVEHFREVGVDFEVAIGVSVAEVFDVLGEVAEEEDVRFADFAGDFNVGSVASTDDQSAVQDELHVAGPTCFRTCGGYVLADVRGRGDDLGLAHIVVFNIDDLQEITDVFIIIDDLANAADKVNDSLSHPVAWSGLASKDRHARCKFLTLFGAHCLDRQVSVNDTKDVQLLALVFVYALDLDIEEGFGVDAYTCRTCNVLRQADFIGVFDLLPLLFEVLVVKEVFELVQLCQIGKELVAAQL